MDTDIMNFGRKSFVTWTRESLEAEKENEMRKLKFRAWDLKEEMMWEVSGIDLGSRTADVFIIKYNPKSEQNERVSNFDMRYPGRVVLMQFTGLKDKNGKDIYVDDILCRSWDFKTSHKTHRYGSEVGLVVQDMSGTYCFENVEGLNPEGSTALWEIENCEIIGNKAQNPKLLEQENDSTNSR